MSHINHATLFDLIDMLAFVFFSFCVYMRDNDGSRVGSMTYFKKKYISSWTEFPDDEMYFEIGKTRQTQIQLMSETSTKITTILGFNGNTSTVNGHSAFHLI